MTGQWCLKSKNFHNSLNSLKYQYSVHSSLLHLLSNFQDAITPQNIAENWEQAHFSTHINALYFRSERAEQLCLTDVVSSQPISDLLSRTVDHTRYKLIPSASSTNNERITATYGPMA